MLPELSAYLQHCYKKKKKGGGGAEFSEEVPC